MCYSTAWLFKWQWPHYSILLGLILMMTRYYIFLLVCDDTIYLVIDMWWWYEADDHSWYNPIIVLLLSLPFMTHRLTDTDWKSLHLKWKLTTLGDTHSRYCCALFLMMTLFHWNVDKWWLCVNVVALTLIFLFYCNLLFYFIRLLNILFYSLHYYSNVLFNDIIHVVFT